MLNKGFNPFIKFKMPNENHVGLIPNETLAVSGIGDILYKNAVGEIINVTQGIRDSLDSIQRTYMMFSVQAIEENQTVFHLEVPYDQRINMTKDGFIVMETTVTNDKEENTYNIVGNTLVTAKAIPLNSVIHVIVFKNFKLLTDHKIIKFNVEATKLTAENIVETVEKRFLLSNELEDKINHAYVDEKLNAHARGFTRHVSYNYKINVTEDNQTVFDLPYPYFDNTSDVILISLHGESYEAFKYVGFRIDEINETIVFEEALTKGSTFGVLILTTLPTDTLNYADGDIIIKNTLDMSKIKDSENKRLVTDDEMFKLNNMRVNNRELNTTLTDIKLKLVDNEIINFTKKSDRGFYDNFKNYADIDIINTTGSLNSSKKEFTFKDKVIPVKINAGVTNSSSILLPVSYFDIIEAGDSINKTHSIVSVDKTTDELSCELTLDNPINIVSGDIIFIYKIYENLKMKTIHFGEYNEIELNLFPKEIPTVQVKGTHSYTDTIRVKNLSNKKLLVTDSIFIDGTDTKILSMTKDIINDVNTVNLSVSEYYMDENAEEIISSSNTTSIVRDSIGNLFKVVSKKVNGNYQIFCFKSKDSGSSWQDMKMPLLSGSDQETPTIACDSKGIIHVIWSSSNGQFNQIKHSKFENEIWSTPSIIQEITGENQVNPTIVIDSSDVLHVVWTGTNKGTSPTTVNKLKYSKFTTSWSTWINISNNDAYIQSTPTMVIDNSNNMYVIYVGNDTSNPTATQIKFVKFTKSSSTWSTPTNIVTLDTHKQLNPFASIDSENNIHVVWEGLNTGITNTQIKYSKLTTSTGIWSGVEIISNNSAYPQTNAVIDLDSVNNIHVAWSGADNNITKPQVKYSKFDKSNSTWSLPVNISPTSKYNQGRPSIYARKLSSIIRPLIIYSGYDNTKLVYYGVYNNILITNVDIVKLDRNVSLEPNMIFPIIQHKITNNDIPLITQSVNETSLVYRGTLQNHTDVSINVEASDTVIRGLAYIIK